VWDESSASNAGVVAIPSQFKVIQQILQLKFVGSLHLEQLRSRSQQRVAATVQESVLRTEMTGTGPVPLVLDLRIAHDRFGSSSDPILNGQLHYPGQRATV
jgi:hypothetical protein